MRESWLIEDRWWTDAAAAPPLLGGGHRRRARPRRLPRARATDAGSAIADSFAVSVQSGGCAVTAGGPRVPACAATAAREPSSTSPSCCSWRSCWAAAPPPQRRRRRRRHRDRRAARGHARAVHRSRRRLLPGSRAVRCGIELEVELVGADRCRVQVRPRQAVTVTERSDGTFAVTLDTAPVGGVETGRGATAKLSLGKRSFSAGADDRRRRHRVVCATARRGSCGRPRRSGSPRPSGTTRRCPRPTSKGMTCMSQRAPARRPEALANVAGGAHAALGGGSQTDRRRETGRTSSRAGVAGEARRVRAGNVREGVRRGKRWRPLCAHGRPRRSVARPPVPHRRAVGPGRPAAGDLARSPTRSTSDRRRSTVGDRVPSGPHRGGEPRRGPRPRRALEDPLHPRGSAGAIAAFSRRLHDDAVVDARTYALDEETFGAEGHVRAELKLGGKYETSTENTRLVAATTRGLDGRWRVRDECLKEATDMTSSSTTAFAGFPREGLEFLEGLADDNSREYFDAHRSRPTSRRCCSPRRTSSSRWARNCGRGSRRCSARSRASTARSCGSTATRASAPTSARTRTTSTSGSGRATAPSRERPGPVHAPAAGDGRRSSAGMHRFEPSALAALPRGRRRRRRRERARGRDQRRDRAARRHGRRPGRTSASRASSTPTTRGRTCCATARCT